MPPTTIVTDLHTGERWTVAAAHSKDGPRLKRWQRERYDGPTVVDGQPLYPCEGCGALGSIGPVGTVHGVRVGELQADRVVNDHHAFTTAPGPVGYGPATVANVCRPCNSGPDRSRSVVSRSLYDAARRGLDAHAERL